MTDHFTGADGRPLDAQTLLDAIPFCRFMGVKAEIREDGLVLVLPFAEHLVGNVMLPALHGGAIGSLLETAALAQVIFELGGGQGLKSVSKSVSKPVPKPVDVTIDYLRSGRPVTSYARARIAKQGRRTINVHAWMWQDDEAKPIAALRGHMLLSRAAAG